LVILCAFDEKLGKFTDFRHCGPLFAVWAPPHQSRATGRAQHPQLRQQLGCADGSINAPGNATKSGDSIVVNLAGSGPLDNAIPTAPLAPLSREKLATSVFVGGAPATIQFSGMTPTFVGLVQVNFVMPSLAAGEYPLRVTIGGVTSNQPALTVAK
jgi:uncharacterized protein (TIGR03437 family)